jgi:sugar lactone lactonase YvrE
MHQTEFQTSAAKGAWLVLVGLASGCVDDDPPATIALPGEDYYPESLSASPSGELYVGSLGTGQIVRADPETAEVTTVVPAGSVGIAGVHVGVDGNSLWACAVDLSTQPPATALRHHDLTTGEIVQQLEFPTAAFCNDLAQDPEGVLYVADSFGKVWRLPGDATALEEWSADPLLAPSQPDGFGADGIVLDPAGFLYVNTYSDGRLLRIPVEADGTAGAVTEIAVTPALVYPDGMRLVDSQTLVLVEVSGTLTQISISGDTGQAVALATDLDAPTSVVRVGDAYWASEGQLAYLFGHATGSPSLPFQLRRVPAP